jgi:vitamin B12 transporter
MKRTIQLSLITTLLLNINLIADEKLEDITVTSATKSTQKLQDVTSNIHVITAQEIEERHYTTVIEALNSLAGIEFNSNGGIGHTSNVYVRGFDSKRVLVLIDGIRYNDASSLSGAPFAHLMVNDIEQIEVIKGAQSGIWGADASAGVINILTKTARKGLHFGVSQEFGSFATTQSKANISYKNDTFYLKASHANVNTKGFSSVAPRDSKLEIFEDDGYTNDTTNLKAGFQINATNKLDFTHIISDSKTEADAYDNATYSFNPNSQYDVKSKTKLSSINFNHIDSFNEVNIFAKKSTFSRYYPQDSLNKNFDGETKEYGLTSTIPYGEEHFVTWGGEYKSFEHKNNLNKKYNNKALFLTNSNKFEGLMGGTTILTQSIRQDNYNKFDNKTTGKIGLKHIHSAIEGLTTSANYGTAYNVPNHYNLFDPYSGNANLTPEDTKGYDVTIEYKDLKVTYFNNTIEDMIDYQSNYDANGNWIGGNYQNITGKSKLKGVEVAYQKDITDDALLSLSYTNLDATDTKGQTLARRAKESVKFGVDYYGIEDVHLGLNGTYIGERYDRANEQGQQTGKYTVANFVANYEVDQHMSIYGKVDNITNKYYQTVDGYATSPRAVYAGMKLTY